MKLFKDDYNDCNILVSTNLTSRGLGKLLII